jgi:hypothetical protein
MAGSSQGRVTGITAGPEEIVICGEQPVDSTGHLSVYELPPYADEIGPKAEPLPSPRRGGVGGEVFEFAIPRFDGARDRLYSRWAVIGPAGRLPGPCYATDLDGVAAADYPYPSAPTIKGLQVRMVDDALKLGVRHAALNLNIGTIMRPGPSETTIPYVLDGVTYYFDGAYMAGYDARVKELSDHGIVVTLILLDSPKWDGVAVHPELKAALLHPDYDPEGFISAFNVVTPEGLAHYKAFVEFVAERYTRPDQRYGRACGYIIGNEVDSGWVWSNAGEKPVEAYVREHAIALRTAFFAARKKYAQARVYLSLDHLWTISHLDNPLRTYKSRDVIEILAALARAEGDYDWSLAFHPYPENLFRPDFWNDVTAEDRFDTPRITFKNIEQLPAYMRQPHLLYDGRLRHIILSEQGFNSEETPGSEQTQAAAYAFAYWRIEQTAGIESFILHAHVDNRDEFGLNLGIWRRDKSSDGPGAPGSPKPIYDIFRDIDGPRRDEVLRWACTVVGEHNWH